MELISVHVPKTAGSSFRKVLEQNYVKSDLLLDYGDMVLDPASRFRADFDDWQEENEERRDISPQVRCVHGHFWAGKYARSFPAARKVVWLRDPARRLISHYFFWQNLPRTNHTLHQRLLDEKMSLLDFAALPGMRNILSDIFLRDFKPADFDFIGIQEFFAEDLAELARMMEWKIQTAPIENKGDARESARLECDPGLLREIADLNEADMQWYGAATARREKRRASQL
jgi:hypothetical protein